MEEMSGNKMLTKENETSPASNPKAEVLAGLQSVRDDLVYVVLGLGKKQGLFEQLAPEAEQTLQIRTLMDGARKLTGLMEEITHEL